MPDREADPVAEALTVALDRWLTTPDAAALRRALLGLLVELDDRAGR